MMKNIILCGWTQEQRMRITIKAANYTIKENLTVLEHRNGKFRSF